MSVAITLGIIFIGLAVGSFLNAVVFRLGSGESALWGRSHCMSCKHVLEWYELIPVASFIMLGGECRACHAPISFQYPIVEILTAAIFFFVHQSYQSALFLDSPFSAAVFFLGGFANFLGLTFYLAAAFLLLAVAVYDFRTFIIAPAFMIPLFLLSMVSLAGQFIPPPSRIPCGFAAGMNGDFKSFPQDSIPCGKVGGFISSSSITAVGQTIVLAVVAFAVFAALWFFSKGRAMGFGDAELAAAIALLLGFSKGLAALLFAFWAGALVGIFLILLGRYKLKSEIPFGPFLSGGALAALIWGDAVIQGYLSFLLL